MKAIKYPVVAPEKIEEREIEIKEVPPGHVLLKTSLTSICRADLRYFFGRRDPEVLKKKYPLCLLHEGVAEVVEGKAKGSKVVVIPNIPCHIHSSAKKCAYCEKIRENYCQKVKFMSSNCDGLSQTHFLQPIECVAAVPEGVPEQVAVLTELLSVCYRAAEDMAVSPDQKVIVFGSGPTGYLMAAVLRFMKKIKKENLYVADINDDKLKFVKEFATVVNPIKESVPDDFDLAFECVGGKAAEKAIESALSALKCNGILMLLGVSEEKVPLKTRVILEKGITIKGTTRSPRQDYPPVLEALKDKAFQEVLHKIIGEQVFNGPSELKAAFKKADDPNNYSKVFIRW